MHRIRVVRHASERGGWEMALATPPPALAPLIRDYCGYREAMPQPMRRQELPGVQVVLILEFGPLLKHLDDAGQVTRHRSGFVAGLDERWSTTEHNGESHGLQVNLTPLGARRLFGLPMHELAHRVTGLEDLWGGEARRLVESLAEARDWAARFAIADAFLLQRAERGPTVDAGVKWAVDRIQRTGGQVDIATLASELGHSHKHLIHQFHEQVGLPPRRLARLLRFDRAVERIKSGGPVRWAELALELGYFDQAHLNRDFRQFTGGPPSALLRRALPDAGGFESGAQVKSVQERPGADGQDAR
ncbi:AraC family transcriptional regulator [Corallococcus sp. AB004]|uniref:AraC family transcriptional regulator n=1 Tax=Corallococcus exiguus TaxID=83462 RepID=UPI000EA1A68F|nr:helix-turn-helix domain-containing protein [Corallococcus exiguus]NPC73622.1 AraC family transcriptional regulator [Corallococcus exiguus]NRD46723.1 AraC family transcriptional regulator [Corallococcus exiguus]RKI36712.1 AraC family transcriptional regulator [Corallococcus sp. AB004]